MSAEPELVAPPPPRHRPRLQRAPLPAVERIHPQGCRCRRCRPPSITIVLTPVQALSLQFVGGCLFLLAIVSLCAIVGLTAPLSVITGSVPGEAR